MAAAGLIAAAFARFFRTRLFLAALAAAAAAYIMGVRPDDRTAIFAATLAWYAALNAWCVAAAWRAGAHSLRIASLTLLAGWLASLALAFGLSLDAIWAFAFVALAQSAMFWRLWRSERSGRPLLLGFLFFSSLLQAAFLAFNHAAGALLEVGAGSYEFERLFRVAVILANRIFDVQLIIVGAYALERVEAIARPDEWAAAWRARRAAFDAIVARLTGRQNAE